MIDTFDDSVLGTMGPPLDIERIPGFDAFGRPLDSSGPSSERDFVFEHSAPRVDFSTIVRDVALNEIFRWSFRDFGPATIEPAAGGGKRYVMHQTHPPTTVSRSRRALPPHGPPRRTTC